MLGANLFVWPLSFLMKHMFRKNLRLIFVWHLDDLLVNVLRIVSGLPHILKNYLVVVGISYAQLDYSASV